MGSGLIGEVPNKLHVDPRDLDVSGASLARDIKLARVVAADEHPANARGQSRRVSGVDCSPLFAIP
jgi:hypothetical protein